MSDFVLTAENYFSLEADTRYMSNSQFKAFMSCQAAAMAEIKDGWNAAQKECFIEGHLFENVVCGAEELFFAQHPEIISTRGESKGQPKSNFLRVLAAAEAVRSQEAVMDEINRCEKQKVITGIINGVAYKGCIDLYNPENGNVWDLKNVKDFKPIYSPDEGRRLEWYEYYMYIQQLALYRELLRQNNLLTGNFGLIAATKEAVPDVVWLMFNPRLLDNSLDIVFELSPVYDMVKKGIVPPTECGQCEYCRAHKTLKKPKIIGGYEND